MLARLLGYSIDSLVKHKDEIVKNSSTVNDESAKGYKKIICQLDKAINEEETYFEKICKEYDIIIEN